MTYSHFRFRAVVDWIELEIHTLRPTNFQTLRRTTRVPYVAAMNAGEGGAATIFRFRVQDPGGWKDIVNLLEPIEERHGLVETPVVTAVEISLDGYCDGSSREDLVELAARFHKFQVRPASMNRRIAGRWAGDVEGLGNHARTKRWLDQGRVIAIGNKSDEWSQRIYVKSTDKGGRPLVEAKHRARIENTLQGDALPARFAEWGRFRFETLSKFYRFRMLKQGLDPLIETTSEVSDQIGERRMRRRREGGTRLYSKATEADQVLNRRAYDALRELSRRWKSDRTPTKRHRPATVADELAGARAPNGRAEISETSAPGTAAVTGDAG